MKIKSYFYIIHSTYNKGLPIAMDFYQTLRVNNKEKLKNLNSYILILISFSIPLSIALPSIFTGLLLIIWLFIGNFKDDWNQVKNNKVVLSSLTLYILAIIGLLWSQSLQLGFSYTLKKEIVFLLIPIYMLFVKRKHIKYYFNAFILAMTISELTSYAIFFKFIAPFGKATIFDPTPFIGHITYNPILAIAIYLLLYNLLFAKQLTSIQRFIYSFFVLTMSINMFVTGGRAGQVVFFVMLCIVLLQYFKDNRLKAILGAVISIPLIFITLYNTSNIFQNRVNLAYTQIEHFQTSKNTSAAIRLNWAIVSWQIIKIHPILGVGTGSFRIEFEKMNDKISPDVKKTINPHNMYIFELVELGVVGLIALLSIFFFQIRYALSSNILIIKYFGFVFPLLYMTIMFSESYLLVPSTTYLFVLFSAILYKKYE